MKNLKSLLILFLSVLFLVNCSVKKLSDEEIEEEYKLKNGIIPATGIMMSYSTLTIKAGETNEDLIATVQPLDVSNKEVIWSTNQSSIVSLQMQPSGKVKLTAKGLVGESAMITARTRDGNFLSNCLVFIADKHVIPTGVTIKAGAGIVDVGSEVFEAQANSNAQLEFNLTPSNATDYFVEWSVTPTVPAGAVTIEPTTGVLTTNSAFNITNFDVPSKYPEVTVAIKGKSYDEGGVLKENPDISYTAKIKPAVDTPVNGIKILIGSTEISSHSLAANSAISLTAVIDPSDATNKTLAWTTSAPAVAAVTCTGDCLSANVTATNSATNGSKATITAKSVSNPSVQKSIEITITGAGDPVSGVIPKLVFPESRTITSPEQVLSDATTVALPTTKAFIKVGGDVTPITAGIKDVCYSVDGPGATQSPNCLEASNNFLTLVAGKITAKDGLIWGTELYKDTTVTITSKDASELSLANCGGAPCKTTFVVRVMKPVKVTGITLAPVPFQNSNGSKPEGAAGTTVYQLVPTIYPPNASNKNVVWNSRDTEVVKVDKYGKATFPAWGGKTDVLAFSQDGGFTAGIVMAAGNYTDLALVDIGATVNFPMGLTDAAMGTLNAPYRIFKTETSYALWEEVRDWATTPCTATGQNPNGIVSGLASPCPTVGKRVDGGELYVFYNWGSRGNRDDNHRQPLAGIDYRDALVWCNAFTEWYNSKEGAALGLVYSKSGVALRNAKTQLTTGANLAATDTVVKALTVNAAAKGFRLPTDVEWEFAARLRSNATNHVTTGGYGGGVNLGGAIYYFTKGDSASGASAAVANDANTNTVSWNVNNTIDALTSNNYTKFVATKAPNALGIYDMGGNVSEYVFNATTTFLCKGGNYGSDHSYTKLGGLNQGITPTPTPFNDIKNLRIGDQISTSVITGNNHDHDPFFYIGFRPVRNK